MKETTVLLAISLCMIKTKKQPKGYPLDILWNFVKHDYPDVYQYIQSKYKSMLKFLKPYSTIFDIKESDGCVSLDVKKIQDLVDVIHEINEWIISTPFVKETKYVTYVNASRIWDQLDQETYAYIKKHYSKILTFFQSLPGEYETVVTKDTVLVRKILTLESKNPPIFKAKDFIEEIREIDSNMQIHDVTNKNCIVEVKEEGLEKLIEIIPKKWRDQLEIHILKNLCEIEFQVARTPHLYYFKERGFKPLKDECTQDDLQQMTKDRIFVQKNRSFIEETLHRISITKGLKEPDLTAVTLRIGRPIYGISEIFKDIVLEDKSILFLGPPGLGKTSMIRDLARFSSKYKKTIVIDSSCEISGYSAHPVIGDAYIIYVPEKSKKEEAMIHAIENRTPEVMIVDEISNIQEFAATQTAATRGVILYATAHGTLKDIKISTIVLKCLGGVTAVTLGDDHMNENNGEKTKLESKGPPLFDVIVEFSKEDKFTWYVYRDVPNLLKCLFKKQPVEREVRRYDEESKSWSEELEQVILEDNRK
jgi:stage III sporulation protein SpoIIIAA